MTLVKRSVKGSALTHNELDANWDHCLDPANQTISDPAGDVTATDVDGAISELAAYNDTHGDIPGGGYNAADFVRVNEQWYLVQDCAGDHTVARDTNVRSNGSVAFKNYNWPNKPTNALSNDILLDEPAISFTVPITDETTAITAGTGVYAFRAPYAMTLRAIRASANTAPTGSALTIDINEGGTTILSTKLTIDAGEKTSTTAATAAVISDTAIADDAEITFDFDGVGSTVAGAGIKVTFYADIV